MTKAEERALEVFPEDIQLFVESQEEPGKWLPVDENAQLRYGYKRGYEQAEKDLGWISAKDKLPGPSEWVVVCIEQHGHAQCLALATYNEETKEWHTANFEEGEQETVYVDYWMPIPNIIKETKK